MKAILFALFVFSFSLWGLTPPRRIPEPKADSLFCVRTKDAIEFRDMQVRDRQDFLKKFGFIPPVPYLAYLPNKDTPFTGIAIAFHPNNRSFVQYEVYYRHGLMDGPWVKWYDNRWNRKQNRILLYSPIPTMEKRGQQAMQGTHRFGRKDGLETSWYENGQKKKEENYKLARKDGLETSWHENGQKEREVNWKEGKMDGLLTEWYENGQKQSERTYKDYKLMSAEVWKPNGEKCPVTKIDEEGNGIVVWYKEDGTKRSWDTFRRGRNLIYQ